MKYAFCLLFFANLNVDIQAKAGSAIFIEYLSEGHFED
jgi:hypothetical protein